MKTYICKRIALVCVLLLCSSVVFADITYKVEKGDTLYSISRKYQITVAELRTANNLSENDIIKAGQKLIIPDADIGTAAALSSNNKSSNASSSAKTKTYVVDLMAINNLDSSSVIKVGQKLKINDVQVVSNTKSQTSSSKPGETVIKINDSLPDTRTYGATVFADSNTKWPVSSPKITQVKGKISGVQLSAKNNEVVSCIHEGTVMYVGVYRGFGQVVFVQSKTGLIYAYTGLGSVKVHKGEYAVSGCELGTAGLDSLSQKYQITFMVFQNGQPIDPAKAPRS